MSIAGEYRPGRKFFAVFITIVLICAVSHNLYAQQSFGDQFRPATFTGNFNDRINGFFPVKAADIDNDGRPDLFGNISGESCSRNGCEFFSEPGWIRNNGGMLPFGTETDFSSNQFSLESGVDFEFIPVPLVPVPGFAPRALDDIDADGDMDLVTYQFDGLYVNRYSGGQPAFARPEQLTSSRLDVYTLAMSDLDGDGDLDLVGYGELIPGELFIQINLGSATEFGPFGDVIPVGFPQVRSSPGNNFILEDIDNDGDNDILTFTRTSPALLINNGSSMPFTASTPVQFIGPVDPFGPVFKSIELLDGDGDGDLDIFGVLRTPQRGGSVRYLENQNSQEYFGEGNTGELIYQPGENCTVNSVNLADINADQRDDLLIHNTGCDDPLFGTSLLLNQGAVQPFSGPPVPALSEFGQPITNGVDADFDNDGDVDLVSYAQNGMSVYLNNGFRGTPMPVISVSYQERVLESDGSVDITFTLDEPQSQAVKFQFGSVPGTATPGEDFFGVFEIVEFEPGETEKSVRIMLLDDDVPEEPETLIGRLAFADGANLPIRLVTITVDDDDTEAVSLSVEDASATEIDGVLEIPVELNRPVSLPISVGVATQDMSGDGFATKGEDYYGGYQLITIPAGQTRATFRITVVRDTVGEPDEKVLVRIFNPRNAVISKANAVGTIKNSIDDRARAQFKIGGFIRIPESIGAYAFTVKLDRVPPQAVTIRFATRSLIGAVAGQDYYGTAGTLTFDGTDEATATVTVLDDTETELSEQFQIRLYNPSDGLLVLPVYSRQDVLIDDND